jgi:hypothetical protein
MISKKLLLVIAIIAGAFVAQTAPAFASGPNCTTVLRNKRGYEAGKLIGKSIVSQAWNGIGQDVDQFDTFMDTVHDLVHTAISGLPNDASDYVKCRAKGLGQGVCDQLGAIQDDVEDICLLDGVVWGDLSGELYCELSIEFGAQDALGLIPVAPTNTCGDAFEDGCHASFTTYATSSTECVPFTAAPNASVFADWQDGMCAYEL